MKFFSINYSKFEKKISFIQKKLLEKCKSNNLKLTGCLNLISIVGINEAYKKFASPHYSYYYHLMVSLRPYFQKPNNEMGFCASHIKCEYKFDPLLNLDSFSTVEFWMNAKTESDKLHEQLRRNEHFEMAEQDALLVKELETKQFTNGGGAHFALSNLGPLSSLAHSSSLKVDEFYYQVSLEAHRWSTLLFFGISTLDGKLMWGTTYNSKFIRREIIKFIIENIQIVFQKLIE